MSCWLVFSNNDLIGSKIISWGSAKNMPIDEVPSHFSYCFKETYVLESRLASGVRADEFEHFKSKNKIIAVFDVTVEVEQIHNKWYLYYKSLYRRVLNKKYDKKGLFYLAWRQFLWKFFNKPIPKVNKKDDPNKYFCTEVFSDLFGENVSMHSPYRLMRQCNGRFKRLL